MSKNSIDAYSPAEMAERVRDAGVRKANLDLGSLLALSVLAGAFIAMGAAFSTHIVTSSELGFGLTRLLAGATFSIGLIFVVLAGAELFTGNNLIVMAFASGQVSLFRLLRSWVLVYTGNLIGSLLTVLLIDQAGTWLADQARVGVTAVTIAVAKTDLDWGTAFFRGILCNALVCLAVWLCYGARSTVGKVVAIVPPITAFVALGFEHCVANMYFIPLGLLLKSQPEVLAAGGLESADLVGLTWSAFAVSLVPVTLGNVIGGSLFVGGLYWYVYLRPRVPSGR